MTNYKNTRFLNNEISKAWSNRILQKFLTEANFTTQESTTENTKKKIYFENKFTTNIHYIKQINLERFNYDRNRPFEYLE